ncbi:hypothetical protein D3C72_2133640 [compost metagenome]
MEGPRVDQCIHATGCGDPQERFQRSFRNRHAGEPAVIADNPYVVFILNLLTLARRYHIQGITLVTRHDHAIQLLPVFFGGDIEVVDNHWG